MNEPVKRAIEVVDETHRELDEEHAKEKARKAQTKEYRMFQRLPNWTKMEFWCDACQIDFAAPAYKCWSEIYNLGSWHSKCHRCERLVYRHVNQKTADPYYEMSAKVRVMRGEAAKEILQPRDYGFQTLYGDPFEHYYRRFQEREEDVFNRYSALGLTGLLADEKDEYQRIKEEIEV